MIIVCQICGSNFEAKRSNGKNCSDECRKEYRRQRMQRLREADPEFYRQQYKEWYAEKGLAYQTEWQRSHPEYQEKSRQRARERSKDLCENHPDIKKQRDARYYQRHKEQLIIQSKTYQQENREKLRPFKHASLVRYRARKANTEGDWTAKQFKELCEQVGNHCAYCHCQFDKLTVDHIVPLSRGGSNDISNIIPACGSCNYSKQDKTPLEFLIKFYIS